MGINLRLSSSPSGTRNLYTATGDGPTQMLKGAFAPVSGYGSSLSQRTYGRAAASTADYYYTDGGPYWFNCYDLNAMGSWGQAIATTKGFRYAWFICMDHAAFWGRDASFIYIAYSNDPGILPDPSTMRPIISGGAEGVLVSGTGGTTNYNVGMFPFFVYNPDATTDKGHLYFQGFVNGATATPAPSWSTVWASSADLDTWTVGGLAMAATGANGFCSTGTIQRTGVNTWVGYSASTYSGIGTGPYRWTSTDGKTFTPGSAFTTDWDDNPGVTPKRSFGANLVTSPITIGSDTYSLCTEDARGPGWSSSTTYALNAIVSARNSLAYKSAQSSNTNHDPLTDNGTWWTPLGAGGQYISLVPITPSTGSIITTGSPPVQRLSSKFDGIYPSPSYLQSVGAIYEDGVAVATALRGFFADNGLTPGAYNGTYTGGGMREQFTDIHGFVLDATAALSSAPFGVSATASSGVATISWFDLPSGRTYRVYRGTTAGTQATLIGDFTGTSATNSPSTGLYYYKVVSLSSGVEQKSRVVSVYVS